MMEVVCGILRSENKVLIVQRGDTENYGKWEFPGGKIKVNETLNEAIKREIKEELNLEIEPINELYSTTYSGIKFYFIICEIFDPNLLLLREHLNHKWLQTIEDLASLKPLMPVDELFLNEKLLFL
jgi:8-oxo-dGTP diphosphatase